MFLSSLVFNIDMAKVGYIFEANSYDAFDADKEWMRQYGCVQVVEESVGHELFSLVIISLSTILKNAQNTVFWIRSIKNNI